MKAFEVGVMSSPRNDDQNTFQMIADFGVKTTQLCNWNPDYWTSTNAKRIARESRESGVSLAAVWVGYSGPSVWNFIEGPSTLGLVPPEYRAQRVEDLKRGAEFAAECGAPAIVTHCGFIPENPGDPLYAGTAAAIEAVAKRCHDLGIGFWFETGQETPVVLLRVIEDVGLPNMGVNLDTANLILYGKANPLDALDVFGAHVRCLHAKDGLYPTNGRELGAEVAIGTGKVPFPKVITRLRELGFQGQVIIEREIHGPQQAQDIRKSIGYLRRLIGRLAK